MRFALLTLALYLLISPLSAQEVRSYDGFNNNIDNPELGAAGTLLKNFVPPVFEDGIAFPNGGNRPNPRYISNSIFAQSEKVDDQRNLSDFVWVFGQFVDHDVTLVENSAIEPAMISVPQGDALFDPFNTGMMVIPMMRSLPASETGSDINNPRGYHNEISSFIDGSNVYGSSEEQANWLRTFEGGKMKVSEDNLLPYNTIDGTFNSPIDHGAPFMADDVGFADKLFVAGDIRANENILLSAMHTVFVREHNRLADLIIAENPSWNDEQVFQHARRYVSGMIQNITFNEWLPAMGIYLPEYQGYNSTIDPTMSNVFSAAAFRLGHTLLNGDIMRLDKSGNEIGQGNIPLKDAFFTPLELLTGGGVDPLFQGMAFQVQQNLDCKVVDDVRNFLFGPPGAGGLDLAAININRGRERGLASYTSIRAAFGLSPINTFSDITKDASMSSGLMEMYGDVHEIDAWVGMLAEDHMADAMIGPTLMAILQRQFQDARDGDRFYFMVDPGLTAEDREVISNTRMSDIIMRNSNIEIMQENVFVADDPRSLLTLRESHLELIPYPNPFVDQFELAMYSDREGTAKVEVYNQMGQQISAQREAVRIGTNVFDIPMSNVSSSGLYTVLVRLNDGTATAKVLKLK